MHTSDIIRLTLDKVFSFYKNPQKGTFNTSFLFSLVWSLISLAATLPIFLLLFFFEVGNDYGSHEIKYWFTDGSLYNIRLIQYLQAVIIMTFPIFAIYLLRKAPEEKYFLRDTFTCINPSLWGTWILLTLGIFLFYTLSFDSYSLLGSEYLFLIGVDNPSFWDWPLLIVELAKDYLPYFGAIIFTMQYYKGNRDKITIRNLVLAVLIMSFIIFNMVKAIHSMYDVYIASFFRMIPFLDGLFPGLLGITLKLAISAWILPGLALAFTYPSKLTHEDPFENIPSLNEKKIM